ncbi:hypothetical protein D3C86_1723170 [compost metagenome]
MSLKTASSLHNRPVIKTEIAIPRNSIIVNNTEIIGYKPRIGAISNHEKQKNESFCSSGWKNDFQKG